MRGSRRIRGFSYVEVLIATVLMSLALIPALESLEVGVRGSVVHRTELVRHQRLMAKIEEVLAEPYSALEAEALAAGGAATAFSDAAGSPDRRLVFLNEFDADGDTEVDAGILRVRVAIEATPHTLETLTLR